MYVYKTCTKICISELQKNGNNPFLKLLFIHVVEY